MQSPPKHLGQELPDINCKVSVDTRYGCVRGGKASTGAVVFLGKYIYKVLMLTPS